jgi:biofilm PGA synthesis N-glycosyltransferase PgaC
MVPWWGLAVLVMGANFALWGLVGVCRLSELLMSKGRHRPAGDERNPTGLPDHRRRAGPLTVRDVAVLIPAHNEAVVIGDSLRAIMALVPHENVHVISDASTDGTVEIARRAGAKVMETATNLGKAGALVAAIRRFELINRFRVVLLLDADTRVEPGYFAAGLPMFDRPDVVAVAGCVRTARGRHLSLIGRILVAHRQRIYAVGQRALKFGQTWMRTNATHIVPGFASMYRTDVLPHIDMDPPGLVIEDFNMTFEIYQKRLGKVGFTLGAVAVTQDPGNFRDYVRQTRRWAVGMWQTVRRHPPQFNLFTAMLSLLLLELIISSLMFLMLPFLLVVLVLPDVAAAVLYWPPFAEVHLAVVSHMRLSGLLFGVVVPDFALTLAVAVLDRRPGLVLIGPLFPLLRLVDSVIGLAAIPLAWFSKASGRWKSPERRVEPADRSEAAVPASAPVPALPVAALPVPAVLVPAAQAPTVRAPVAQTPAVRAPAVEIPAVEIPAVETPAVQSAAPQTPAHQAPANGDQADQAGSAPGSPGRSEQPGAPAQPSPTRAG